MCICTMIVSIQKHGQDFNHVQTQSCRQVTNHQPGIMKSDIIHKSGATNFTFTFTFNFLREGVGMFLWGCLEKESL